MKNSFFPTYDHKYGGELLIIIESGASLLNTHFILTLSGPAEHPFSMNGGNHCCKHFKTKDANGATRIGENDPVSHCRGDDYVACTGLGCHDAVDAESK